MISLTSKIPLSTIDKKLTIVLVIKDRVQFTYRWMEYADTVSMPFKIVIADGGKDKKIKDFLLSRKHYPNINYQYLRYPYDETYSDYYNKLASVLEVVDTEYMVFADNDDFYIVDGLRKSIKFLINNPNYSSCRGEIGGLFQKNKKDFEFGISSTELFDLDSNSASDRIVKHLRNYNDSYYDVCKTENRRFSFNKIRDISSSDLFVTEMIDSCLTVCFGKIKREKYLYLVRQNNSPESSALIAEKENDTFGRMFAETWSHDINSFLILISEMISKVDHTKNNQIYLLKNGYRKHLSKAIIQNLSKDMGIISRFFILNSLKINIIIPNGFISFLYRKFYSIICRVKYKNGTIAGFFSKNIWFYNDVLPIAKVLIKKSKT